MIHIGWLTSDSLLMLYVNTKITSQILKYGNILQLQYVQSNMQFRADLYDCIPIATNNKIYILFTFVRACVCTYSCKMKREYIAS